MTRTFGLRVVRLAASPRGQTALFRQLRLRLRAWRARYSTSTVLNALDDRTLRDIGVRRGEIESVSFAVARGARRGRELTLGDLRRRSFLAGRP